MATLDAEHVSIVSLPLSRRSHRSVMIGRVGRRIQPLWMLFGMAALSWGVVFLAAGLLDRLVDLA